MEPLLSVVTITYNHEPYIAKCIEGVLMQKVDFPIEFIIAEDCSTDGTRAICEDYASKYPDLIRLILSEKNIGAVQNERHAMSLARGRYVALCEGDDYWTDEFKLQKQVGFLESNPEYTICFHDRMVEKSGEIIFENRFDRFVAPDGIGFDLTLELFYHNWITYPFSMVFKRDSFRLVWYDDYAYFRDSHLILLILLQGKGYVFKFVGGVRTIHADSMYHSMDSCQSAKMDMLVYKELYRHNRSTAEGKNLRKEYANRIQALLNALKASDAGTFRCIGVALSLFCVNLSLKTLVKNLISICKK